MMPRRLNNTAQQIIEYLLVGAAVIAGIITFVARGPFRGAVEKVIDISLEQVKTETEKLCVGDDCPTGVPSCSDPALDCVAFCGICRDECSPCCGDGSCDAGEGGFCDKDCVLCGQPGFDCSEPANCATCAACRPCCGDGACNNGETLTSCPSDGCVAQCGEVGFVCTAANCKTCSACVPCCGNGSCERNRGENSQTCASDCVAECSIPLDPNFDCTVAANCASCALCSPCDGDGVCNEANGETCCNSDDCKPCSCGNGRCDSCNGETPASCPQDCGAV